MRHQTPLLMAKGHSFGVRLAHWINAGALTMMVWSGVRILFAHPRLYWGDYGYYGYEPALDFADYGIVIWGNSNWGRNTHFLFAWVFVLNGLAYLVAGMLRQHFRERFMPRREELTSRYLLADIREHLRFRMPRSSSGDEYNVLQKLSYIGVVFVLCPFMLFTGLTMSPAVVSAFPWLIDLFGGRQSARTLHFVGMMLLILFFLVHLIQVIRIGPWAALWAMTFSRLPSAAPRKP